MSDPSSAVVIYIAAAQAANGFDRFAKLGMKSGETMGKRSRMNDQGNSGELPDDAPEVVLVEEQQDDHGADDGNGQAHSNISHTNKVFAGCIPASVDELEDLIIVLREENGRIRADRMRGGEPEYLCHLPAVDFDLCRFLDEWGAGRYRIMGRVDGEKRAKWKRIVTVAAKPGTQARAVEGNQVPSDPRLAPQPPAYPGWPPPPYYATQYPPPPAPAVSAAPEVGFFKAMFEVQAEQSKQTSALLMQLLTQKVDTATKPAISSEIGELLKVIKDLRSFSRGGGDDDDDGDGDFSSALGKIGAAFMRELEQQRTVVPAPAAAAVASVVGTSRPAPTPRPADSSAVAAGASRATSPSQTRTPRATPTVALTAEARIKRFAKLIVATEDDPDRDAESFAIVAISVLGEELTAQALQSMGPGQLTAWLINQIPQLSPSASFLEDVERELRDQYRPEATDSPADDAPAAHNNGSAAGASDEPT